LAGLVRDAPPDEDGARLGLDRGPVDGQPSPVAEQRATVLGPRADDGDGPVLQCGRAGQRPVDRHAVDAGWVGQRLDRALGLYDGTVFAGAGLAADGHAGAEIGRVGAGEDRGLRVTVDDREPDHLAGLVDLGHATLEAHGLAVVLVELVETDLGRVDEGRKGVQQGDDRERLEQTDPHG
jgi:hypothetical protein